MTPASMRAGVEGMAEIVETDVGGFGHVSMRFPGAFHDPDRTAAKVDHQAVSLAVLKQILVQPLGEGNLTGLPSGVFERVTNRTFCEKSTSSQRGW